MWIVSVDHYFISSSAVTRDTVLIACVYGLALSRILSLRYLSLYSLFEIAHHALSPLLTLVFNTTPLTYPHPALPSALCDLLQSPSAPDSRDGCSPVPPVAAFQWLDDAQLGALTTAELETVMDRYLLSVVQQLVQVGASHLCIPFL